MNKVKKTAAVEKHARNLQQAVLFCELMSWKEQRTTHIKTLNQRWWKLQIQYFFFFFVRIILRKLLNNVKLL